MDNHRAASSDQRTNAPLLTLDDALTALAERLDIDPAAMRAYAIETNRGGRHHGYSGMAMDVIECRVLYACVRALRPGTVIEIGTHEGCTTNWILAALAKNKHGHLYSYDIDPAAGALVDGDLSNRWTLITADALTADLPPGAIDLVFEDGPHVAPWTGDMHACIFHVMRPRLMLTHDYYSHLLYDNFHVQSECEGVYGTQVHGFTLPDAPRGMGYWINDDDY